MRRLSGADSMFVYNETPARHQHTLKIAVIDPDGADTDVSYEALREQIAEALPLLEPFHWRLALVPGNLGHPYWLETGELDLGYHVRHTTAAPPGGPHELAAVISTIAGTNLDRRHPLWQVWFVDGLAGGQVAYVAKVHHSLADGVSSARLLAEAFSERADTTPVAPDVALSHEPMPSAFAMLKLGLRDVFAMIVALPSLLVRTWRRSRRSRSHSEAGAAPTTKPFSGPHTPFDEPLTPNRVLVYETFGLDEFKTVRRAFNVSVNDVVLAVASSGLRRYLARRGELPGSSLTAAVPVSVRADGEERTWGNRVASWYVTLATEFDDPVERLQAIARSTRAARARLDETDREFQHAWAEYWRLFRMTTMSMPRLARRLIHRPSYNVIVSSVAGPPRPLYRHGARLVHMISMGPLVDGIGINFTAWSYADEMTVAVMSCPEVAPDLAAITADMRAGLDELLAAARALTTAP